MGYDRYTDSWDLLNPLIELVQELTAVKIWGQEIRWGISWGAYLNQEYYAQGTNVDAIYDTGTGLSLIDAIIELNDGEVPLSSVTYLFGVEGPVETWSECTMALGWWYYGTEPYCYCQIGTTGLMSESGFTNGFNNLASNLSSRCGVHGFNPLAITDADRAIFTVYFCTPSVTDDSTRPDWMTQKFVKTWQVGDCYNTNRATEASYLLTNEGDITQIPGPAGSIIDLRHPAYDADHPENSALYYKYGQSFVQNWHFPTALAVDLNDWYENDVEDGEIGGDGDYATGSDSLGVPDIPTRGILQSGMVKLYLPEPLDLKNFADELWTDNASIAAAFGSMVASPIEAVINLGLLPLNLSSYRESAVNVKMGSYTMTATMSPCKKEFFPMDLGTVRINEKWGSALDYAPYTKFSLYLPYVGYVDLQPEDFLKKDLSVFYYINLFTGDFVAWVYVTSGKVSNPLLQYTGNMMFKMPITAMDYSSYYKNQHDLFAGALGSFASGNIFGGIVDSVAFAAGCAQPAGNVKRAGEFSGSTAIMAYPQPFIIRTVPRQVFQGSKQDQSGFDKYVGFPSYKILTLYDDMGFVKINDIILDDLVLTDAEEQELRALLKEGVYF